MKGAHSGLAQCLAAEGPLKMMKDAFYFMSKALSVLKIFNFLSWLFCHVTKRLNKEDQVNSKFYDVTAWLRNNCIHILPNASRNRKNQTMKFCQLIECNMRNTFLEKLSTKCGGEIIAFKSRATEIHWN